MSNASGDDEELKELLDEQHAAWWEYGCWLVNERDKYLAKAFSFDRIDEARKRVESLFGRISQQVAFLETELARKNQRILEDGAELGRIREAALTPEEARVLILYLDHKHKGIPIPQREEFALLGKSADAKLRFISGGALKEGATQ